MLQNWPYKRAFLTLRRAFLIKYLNKMSFWPRFWPYKRAFLTLRWYFSLIKCQFRSGLANNWPYKRVDLTSVDLTSGRDCISFLEDLWVEHEIDVPWSRFFRFQTKEGASDGDKFSSLSSLHADNPSVCERVQSVQPFHGRWIYARLRATMHQVLLAGVIIRGLPPMTSALEGGGG